MSALTWITFLMAICVQCACADYTAVVNVTAGSLRGVTTNGYYSYLGIPYATVEKRFQAAKPVTSWHGILDAVNGNVQCKQKNPLSPTSYTLWQFSAQGFPLVVGSDDCLLLNVYTNAAPYDSESRLRPVMVYIYGGAYEYGSGATALYGPDFLLQHDVVVVTFNYRLDILGFLCLGIEEAPGNAAMKDQILALKWVQENIKVFGGDPDNVTIFGESAGGGAVGMHLVSPMSKGLFHRAILQSGSPLSPWSIQHDPLNVANRLANVLGSNASNPHEVYNLLINKTDDEIQALQIPRTEGERFVQNMLLSPCVENNIPGVEPFLTDLPYNIISKNEHTKVPLIIGTTSNEQFVFVSSETQDNLASINGHFRNTLYGDLEFPSEDEANAVADEARKLYFGDDPINSTNIAPYGSDHDNKYGAYATIDAYLKTSDVSVYGYEFAYNGTRSLMKKIIGAVNFTGAGHFEDIYYLFSPVYLSLSTATDQDKAIIGNMTAMWTNFAKYGNPTPEGSTTLPSWKPVDKNDQTLFVIDEQFTYKKIWDSDRMQFWKRIHEKYIRTTAQSW